VIADSSAITAVFFRQRGYAALIDKLAVAGTVGIGAPTLAVTELALARRLGRDAHPLLARFLQEFGLVVVPFGEAHCRAAAEAFHRYGKGRHAAALDLSDCLAYATARLARQPILCCGRRFARTDLEVA
jgi:ribonuclease VapC